MNDQYSEYPITLSHPGFQPAKMEPVLGSEIYGPHGQVVRRDIKGTPVRFPPVVVSNANEEEFYSAEGYTRAGTMDPSAWVQAHTDAPEDTYVPEKYPLWRGDRLIKTIEDDDEASEEERLEAISARHQHEQVHGGVPSPPKSDAEVEVLRTQIAEMQAVMAALTKELRAKGDAPAAVAEAPKPIMVEPVVTTTQKASAHKAKRAYNRKPKAA